MVKAMQEHSKIVDELRAELIEIKFELLELKSR